MLVVAVAVGLLLLGAGGALGGGAVAAYDLEQAVFLLDGGEFAVGGEVVVPVACGAQVASDHGGGDVDVVGCVADGDPAAAVRVAVGCDAGGGDDAAGDVGPLVVAEDAVVGRGADRAVPDVVAPGRGRVAGLLDAQVEVGHEELLGGGDVVGAAGVGGEAVPGGDQVRVGVFVGPAGAVEVVDEAGGALAAADLRDHQAAFLVAAWLAACAMWRTAVPTVRQGAFGLGEEGGVPRVWMAAGVEHRGRSG